MVKMPFLESTAASIRKSIKDIDDSYRNPWDIFAELSQNAVDAIKKMQETSDEDGKIKIIINSQRKSIYFEDNGCGIAYADLPKLLNLFTSGKDDDPSSVGEKGVGLKFVLFQSTFFKIESSDGNSAGRVIINDASIWKKGRSEDIIQLDEYDEIEPNWRGTKITLEGIEFDRDEGEQSLSLFQLSFDQLKYVLRNKTYLGSTVPIWDDDYKPINISLNYTDFNGEQHEDTLKNEYILPTEVLPSKDMIDLDQFEEWLGLCDRSDDEKRKKLKGKVLVKKGSYPHLGYRNISYWVCFLPNRGDWDTLNKRMNLVPSETEIDDSFKEKNGYCLCSAGIYTATKGMPTGISITQPITGSAGYWPNFFMLFQDDVLRFDIGRKSIHGNIQSIYQKLAKEIFNSIIPKYVTKYTLSMPLDSSSTDGFDKIKIIDNIRQLVDLNSENVSFVKNPSEQEASVSAIFFELIGNGSITDIIPIYLGYRNKYDLYAYFKSKTGDPRFVFCEFKSHLRKLKDDFPDETKIFDELDYVICWDVNDKDIQDLYNFGIRCDKIENSTLHSIDCPKSVTHSLSIPNCKTVYVIDLKELV